MGDITQLFSERSDNHILLTEVSENGSYIIAGQNSGKLSIFNDSGIEKTVSTPISHTPSQVYISENDFCCYATFSRKGLYGITGNGSWFVELDGLWATDTVSNGSGICAVSNPPEGPGTAIYVEDSQEKWRCELQESVGFDIAINPDSSKIAIGAAKYQDNNDPLDPKGTAGVYYYEWGNKHWVEKTNEDVIGIMMDSSRGSIIAGLDDGSIMSLNLEGERLMRKDGIAVASKIEWEQAKQGGFISPSKDNSTLASWVGDTVKVFDSYGNEKWGVTIEGMPIWGDWIKVNADGTRIIAGTSEGHIYVMDSGKIIWEEYYEEGPVKGSISDDGGTWSIAIQDNSHQEITIKAFRDRGIKSGE